MIALIFKSLTLQQEDMTNNSAEKKTKKNTEKRKKRKMFEMLLVCYQPTNQPHPSQLGKPYNGAIFSFHLTKTKPPSIETSSSFLHI